MASPYIDIRSPGGLRSVKVTETGVDRSRKPHPAAITDVCVDYPGDLHGVDSVEIYVCDTRQLDARDRSGRNIGDTTYLENSRAPADPANEIE